MKELNNELSRKLEAQTQRLELLTAKSMAGEIIPARQPDARDVPEMPDNTPYADEGDEVLFRFLSFFFRLNVYLALALGIHHILANPNIFLMYFMFKIFNIIS